MLVPAKGHHLYDTSMRHYDSLSRLLCIHLTKPPSVTSNAVKSKKIVETHEGTHDGFIILCHLMRKQLPQIGDYGSHIAPAEEHPKLFTNA